MRRSFSRFVDPQLSFSGLQFLFLLAHCDASQRKEERQIDRDTDVVQFVCQR